ncbi:hypothetical protein PTNB85_09589 [Pyrenophora teres f. teres]|uniref:Polysaccharide export protein n=1 Tax=Pyrenophora teres f. teres TaxID=97479 RepID=A0A6S6WD92_9PLEO|nr:hypothetical protein PTNB85_09589 [Pyrenophora teres f. teres]KAE8831736.1 hypothetical protein HRS9139_05978 [Pyrenophora teres f. teres]KAE8858427.1 hypothetical protein PTNB29_07642 [Pyrenophora teres f. teres]CAE7206105.1 Polysaccharide export protein [Pyrenophora teres f. teres]
MQKPDYLMPRYRSYSFRRRPRSYAFQLLALLLVLWDSLHCITLYSRQIVILSAPPPPRNTKRIFIASQHWNQALVALVQELGIENVFVSIYESGSYDDSKDALRELDATLERLQIAQQPTEHGWIKTPDGETRMRRIPFLATVRNRVFQSLEHLTAAGEHFDTVLFLNDVVFTPKDVLRLLDTNGGNYAAACSMDFAKPPEFYDTFALRDSQGHEAVMQTWPYFRSYVSRYAAERFLPVPVASCWNGMVAMPIDPFVASPPLRFRDIPDSLATSHVEASECCLIHADNPFSASKGVFLNPNVKVGYNGSAFDAVNSPQAIMSPFNIWTAVWKNRVLRVFTHPFFKEHVVSQRLRKWSTETEQRSERGEFCLINEMQILYEKGWRHM